MKKTIPLVSAIILSTASPSFAQLKVDFDLVDTNGAYVGLSYPESSFESFMAADQTVGNAHDVFRTQSFSTTWGTVNVTLSSDADTGATNYYQVPREIVRDSQIGNYDGVLPDLVRDWVGIDTRPTPANATRLNLSFSGLPAGEYELVSYHQDAADQTGLFNIYANGTQVATNVQIHSSAAGANPGADNPPFFVVTRFSADGVNPSVISFQMTTTNSASSSERIMVLNGFILASRGQGLLIYSFAANPASVFEGQTATLSWVTRSNAQVTIDLLGDVTSLMTNGVGSINFTPSDYASPGSSATFTLQAQDPNTFEQEERSLTVLVQPDIVSFKTTPHFIRPIESVTLSWTANPAASISMDQGIGNVNGLTSPTGDGNYTVTPSVTTTYTLTTDRNGNVSQTNVTVLVIPYRGTGTLTNGLVAYWPMDLVQGANTPDVVHGYDLTLEGSTLPVLTEGHQGNAFQFTGAGDLYRIAAAGDELPANKHDSFSVSMWVKVDGTTLDDKRVFSEGNTTDNSPLFNLGTAGGLPNEELGREMSIYIRRADASLEVNHTNTTGTPFDNTWHLITFMQSNNVRSVYIDGERDPVVMVDRDPAQWHTNDFNVTSIGAIRRASSMAYVSGLIDEVAVWNRALSDSEVAELYLGYRDIPPPIIASFTADFPTVVNGDTVVLRWDTSPIATLTIDQGIGNVDAHTYFGVGSIAVPITAPVQFTLTASLGPEILDTAMVSVSVVNGIAPGWRVVDNFETYQAGPVLGQGHWLNGTGVATVLNQGGNKVLGFTQTAGDIVGAGLLSALELRSFSIPEGSKATLFFRVYASAAATGTNAITLHAGLTDRFIRFVGDFTDDIGPYIRLEKAPGTDTGTPISLLAPNGVGVALTNASLSLNYDTVYDVWIDVTNDVIASNDVFSVYLKADGDANRTLVFQNLRGDRDPAGDETGPVQPALYNVFFALLGLNQGTNNLLVDDLYMSTGDYLGTVPVAAGLYVPRPVITPGVFSTGTFEFSWSSEMGATYTVQYKQHLSDAWQNLVTGYPTDGATGTLTFYTDSTASTSTRFYRVIGE